MKKTDDIDPGALERAREWLLTLSDQNITALQLSSFEQWLASDIMHRRAFERERGFWQDLEAHGRLFEPPCVPKQRVRHTKRHWLFRPHSATWGGGATIAASLLLYLAGPAMVLQFRSDYITGQGEMRTVSLPDRSVAMLDSGSAIAVRYSGEARAIELLRGRAWFNVQHADNRPFRVAAVGGIAEDIGTAYEVVRQEGGAVVAVSEGAVLVRAESGKAMTLHAGEQVRYDGAHVTKLRGTAPDRIASWRNGELLIDDMSLADAVEQVARYRKGPTFLLSNKAAQKHVSGVFRTDQPNDALAALARNAGLKVLHLPAGVVILR